MRCRWLRHPHRLRDRRVSRVLACALLLFAATPSNTARAADDPPAHVLEFPFLDDEVPDGSRSVGDTSNGYLVGAKKLEESERLAVLPKQRERGLSFGSDQLLAMLDEAGAKLHDATGTKLWLGNLARRYGGDIPWSVSHNSGRDADIAFAYRDANGHPADPPDLVPLDSAGYSNRTSPRSNTSSSAPR